MGFCVARTIPIPYARACLSSINMGAFDGGFPAAGKKPKISSIYRIVLSDDVPVCLRIQLMYRLRKRVIKNILWASLRCAIERIDTLGFPVSVYRSFLISRDSPCVQSSNPGLARTLLSNIASLRRSSYREIDRPLIVLSLDQPPFQGKKFRVFHKRVLFSSLILPIF